MRKIGLYSIAVLASGALLVGCEKEKDLSPPSVNLSASDVVKIAVAFDDPAGSSRYKVSMQVEYGNLALECSNVRHLQGGSVDYPHGYVNIENQEGNIFPVYRDYFVKRKKCQWNLLGVGVTIRDKLSSHWGGGSLNAHQITDDFKQEWVCQPFNSDGSATCLRKDLVGFPRGISLKVFSLNN